MTDIPTLGRPHEMPAIRNSDDLYLRWRALMGPLGFGRPRLWIAFLEPDNMMSVPLTQIEDIPRRADSRMCGSLLEMCRHVVGRNGARGSVAMLLTRPGQNPMDEADRSWAHCLTSAADHLSVSMWPVHFANDVELQVFAPDDLVEGLVGVSVGYRAPPHGEGGSAEALFPLRATTTAADSRCSRRRSAGGDGGTTLFRSARSDEDGGNPADIAASEASN